MALQKKIRGGQQYRVKLRETPNRVTKAASGNRILSDMKGFFSDDSIVTSAKNSSKRSLIERVVKRTPDVDNYTEWV
jgi:hypothetical protein